MNGLNEVIVPVRFQSRVQQAVGFVREEQRKVKEFNDLIHVRRIALPKLGKRVHQEWLIKPDGLVQLFVKSAVFVLIEGSDVSNRMTIFFDYNDRNHA